MVNWSAIVVTCPSGPFGQALEKEVLQYQQLGLIDDTVSILWVPDPSEKLGSGGATLNAILSVTEYISSTRGFSVVNADVLHDSTICIFHVAGSFALDLGSRALTVLPTTGRPLTNTILLDAFQKLSALLRTTSRPGVWVVSTNQHIEFSPDFEVHLDGVDMLTVATAVPCEEVANVHSSFVIGEDGTLKDVLNRPSLERCRELADADGRLPINSAFLYLSPGMAEKFVSFNELSPLSSCTYLGLDSGYEPVRLSLWVDILRAAASDVSQEDFVARGLTPDSQRSDRNLVDTVSTLNVIYTQLHGRVTAKVAYDTGGRYTYLLPRPAALHQLYSRLNQRSMPRLELHSADCEVADTAVLVNSHLARAVVGAGSTVVNCLLEGTQLVVGAGCYLNGITSSLLNSPLVVGDRISLLALPLRLHDGSKHQTYVLFGSSDEMMTPLAEGGTFCNTPWQQYLNTKGLKTTDLWMDDCAQNIYNAKLFPVLAAGDSQSLCFWLQKRDSSLAPQWRSSWRWSLSELMQHVDYDVILHQRFLCLRRIVEATVRQALLHDEYPNMSHFYKAAARNGFSLHLLGVLDEVCMVTPDSRKLGMLFANVANLIGEMAQGRGGIRSGPAGNPEWTQAYQMLRQRRYTDAVQLMQRLRSGWLEQPQLLIRAARHYEGAQQIMTQISCSTAQRYISLKQTDRPGLDEWVEVRCPIRVDLMGAWSDTPPVCYEHGGAVVNVALTVRGKKPIGVQLRRIAEPIVQVGSLTPTGDLVENIRLTKLSDVADYTHPFAPCALVKACLVATGLIDMESQESLPDQLMTKLRSGVELHTWTHLPRGSGLGTSSILAGGVCGGLWTLMGSTYDASSVIHAVLHYEQLMTTAGGWQDQVGGVLPSAKIGFSHAEVPVHIQWRMLDLSAEIIAEFGRRFVCIYTGKTRLAKNLVQNVIRNWYECEESVLGAEDDLEQLSYQLAQKLEAGQLDQVGSFLTRHQELKKVMATGSLPHFVAELIDYVAPLIDGATMAGAGGGGFLYCFLKHGSTKANLTALLAAAPPQFSEVEFFDTDVDEDGMTVSLRPASSGDAARVLWAAKDKAASR